MTTKLVVLLATTMPLIVGPLLVLPSTCDGFAFSSSSTTTKMTKPSILVKLPSLILSSKSPLISRSVRTRVNSMIADDNEGGSLSDVPNGDTDSNNNNMIIPDENTDLDPFFITTTQVTSKMTFKNDYGDNMVENKASPRLKLYSPPGLDDDVDTGNDNNNNNNDDDFVNQHVTTNGEQGLTVHGGATTTTTIVSSTESALKLYSSMVAEERQNNINDETKPASSTFQVGDQGDNMSEVKRQGRLKLYNSGESSNADGGNSQSKSTAASSFQVGDQGDNMSEVKPQTKLRLYNRGGDEDEDGSSQPPSTLPSSFQVGDQGDNMSEVKRQTRLKLYNSDGPIVDDGTSSSSLPASPPQPQQPALKLYSQPSEDTTSETNQAPKEVMVESTTARTVVPPTLRRFSQLSEEEKSAATKISVLSTGGLQSRFGLKDQGDNLVEKKGPSKLRLYSDLSSTDDDVSAAPAKTSSATPVTVPGSRIARKDQGDNIEIGVPRRTKLRLHGTENVFVDETISTPSPINKADNLAPTPTQVPQEEEQQQQQPVEEIPTEAVADTVGTNESSDISTPKVPAIQVDQQQPLDPPKQNIISDVRMESTPPSWASTSSSYSSYLKPSTFKNENEVSKNEGKKPTLRFYSPVTNDNNQESTSSSPSKSTPTQKKSVKAYTPPASSPGVVPDEERSVSTTNESSRPKRRLKLYEPNKSTQMLTTDDKKKIDEKEQKFAGGEKGGRTEDGFFIVSD